jgi:hypothetical protein
MTVVVSTRSNGVGMRPDTWTARRRAGMLPGSTALFFAFRDAVA